MQSRPSVHQMSRPKSNAYVLLERAPDADIDLQCLVPELPELRLTKDVIQKVAKAFRGNFR